MPRCSDCGISARTSKPMCWQRHGLCLVCCCKKHPEEYAPNVVEKALKYQSIKVSTRRINICKNCNGTIKKLGFHGNGKHVTISAGYCATCACISVYDPRLKTEVMN